MIRNGLPPSISAWAHECGRAGRDGQQSFAYILYSDNDIQHVAFWARDMATQHRSTILLNLFSYASPFSYSQLSGKCRHKLLVSMFCETEDISCPTSCCDVRQMEVAPYMKEKRNFQY